MRAEDIDCDEESAKIYDKYEKYENEFVSHLQTPELKEMYHKLNDAFFDMDCDGNNNFLIGGFRLGFLMALEVVGFKPPKNIE